MRVGDVRKIEGMLKNKVSDEEIIARFKWDYTEDEITHFIKGAKTPAKKPVTKAKPAAKK